MYLSQMSWNGSEQLEKAMEEVLDDDDDDEMKVEKSNVEKMEKHSTPAAGISFRFNPPVSMKGLHWGWTGPDPSTLSFLKAVPG